MVQIGPCIYSAIAKWFPTFPFPKMDHLFGDNIPDIDKRNAKWKPAVAPFPNSSRNCFNKTINRITRKCRKRA